MTRRKPGSLRGMIRMMIFSMGLTIAGSWGLLLPRLDLEIIQGIIDRRQMNLFYLDLICLTLTFLGLFMSVYYRVRLGPRLKRMEYLGEDSW